MEMLESGPSPGAAHVGSNRGGEPHDFHEDSHGYMTISSLALGRVDWYISMGGPMEMEESGQVAIHHHKKPDAW